MAKDKAESPSGITLQMISNEEAKGLVAQKENLGMATKTNEKKALYWSLFRQLICASLISTPTFAISFLIASTSFIPAILGTNSTNTTFGSDNVILTVSLPTLSTIPATFLGYLLTNYFGMTTLLRGSLFICFVIFILMAYFPSIAVIFAIRIILHLTTGITNVLRFPLITELSEPNIRGMCGSLNELGISFGILFTFTLLTFLSPFNAILCNSIPFLVGFLGTFYVPESPLWLIERGKIEEAQKSLARVIGPSRKDRQKELFQEALSRYEINTHSDSTLKQVKSLKKSKNWKPLVMTISLFAFREFGGHTMVFFFALTIFEGVSNSLDKEYCSVIIGVITVVSTFIAAIFQDVLGRRSILIKSGIMSAICLFIAGIIVYLDKRNLDIVSLVAVLLFTFISGVGMGPVPFILLGELAPSEVRFLNTSIGMAFLMFFQFVVIIAGPYLLDLMGIGILFISFAAINVVSTIIIFFTLKETNLKTLAELDNLYG